MKKRILLMYISKNSGHHRASGAIENALHGLSNEVETLNVDSFHYTNPILEKIINKTYMTVIKRRPEVWGYLYDNPKVVKKTRRLKESIHKYNSHKIKNLLDEFRPDAIVCTQAFPCGIVADYKKTHGLDLFLAGVLTDYAPHSYWLYNSVDIYFVPTEEIKEKLIVNGVAKERIRVTGIPIDPKFKKITNRTGEPTVLLMGGSQGIGPIKEIITVLNNSKINFRLIVVTGGNKKLYRYLQRKAPHFNKKTVVYGYAENIDELMEEASIIISKPGGITTSEALAKGLPILIVKPIPGHERMNTEYLLKNKVAIKIDNLKDIEVFVGELLSNQTALQNMKERAKALSKPNSALDIARTVLEKVM